MWPWGHLAVGYLCYTLYCWGRGRTPQGIAVLWLAVGTQLPDLIDKPLAYWTPLLPVGRALAHSLLFAILLVGGVIYITARRGKREYGSAFAIGHLSHLLADSWQALLGWRVDAMSYLLWPVREPPAYETQGFGPHLERLQETLRHADPATVLEAPLESATGQLGVALLTLLLWLYHGRVGLATLRKLIATTP